MSISFNLAMNWKSTNDILKRISNLASRRSFLLAAILAVLQSAGFFGVTGTYAQTPGVLQGASPAVPLPDDSPGAPLSSMPPELEQVARLIGALDVMRQIENLQSELRAFNPNVNQNANQNKALMSPFEYLSKRQKLIYLRQKLNMNLETANLEVNATRGQIESLMAQVQSQQASMVERRARTLRRISIINFISGGLTKMVGYSISLGNYDLPSNILEVFDGSVQCGLSATTMKDLHEEGHLVKDTPPLLAALDDPDNSRGIYPAQVWSYLSESSAGAAGQTRRDVLSAGWEKRGMFTRRDRATSLRATGRLTHHLSLARITPQLLDDRLAMLGELRAVVSQMYLSLMRLGQRVKRSYDEDPSFDWPVAAKPSGG